MLMKLFLPSKPKIFDLFHRRKLRDLFEPKNYDWSSSSLTEFSLTDAIEVELLSYIAGFLLLFI